jgi:hypothetical protein
MGCAGETGRKPIDDK